MFTFAFLLGHLSRHLFGDLSWDAATLLAWHLPALLLRNMPWHLPSDGTALGHGDGLADFRGHLTCHLSAGQLGNVGTDLSWHLLGNLLRHLAALGTLDIVAAL